MAKRLSMLFSSSKEDTANTSPATDRQTTSPITISPVTGKLQKHRLTSSSELALDTSNPPLLPPPTFHETTRGITPRPLSSRPESRNGTSGSERAGSPSSRESSRSRPQTPSMLAPPGMIPSPMQSSPGTPNSLKSAKKRSWMAGKSEKSKESSDLGDPKAWIAGLKEHIPYDITSLLRGERISELWDDKGDVLVYLYPESTQRGPCFRVQSALFADSRSLSYLALTPLPTLPSLDLSFQDLSLNSNEDFGPFLQRPYTPSNSAPNFSVPSIRTPAVQPKPLYLPLKLEGNYEAPGAFPQGDDMELIVLYRNFFAFLCGGALVSTNRQVSLFSIFMGIGTILKRLQYTNADNSSTGDLAASSFARYCDELRLADVRTSREKTIEAIVLGEQFRSWPLYNEGFVHASGRLKDVKSIRSPKFSKISPITVNRLERAHLDVETRMMTVRHKLEDFDFPSMFSGIANSQTATEAKLIRFKAWKLAFLDFKKFTTAQYRRKYGAWPPKASSKKNKFEENGLNRLVLKELYQDFTDLYDMLVDRRELTTRSSDTTTAMNDAANQDKNETIQHCLRTVESEYDRSTPPVMPPIPFDTPLLPAYAQSFKGGNALVSKHTGMKLKPNELNELLLGSYNRENIRPTPWIQDFIEYERKLCAGATVDEVVDIRCGQWLFLYAVLQALPMAVVDARDLKYTEGVEYFLFAAPRGGKPWMREDSVTSRSWYNVNSGGTTVSLSADTLDHTPEGVYRRSHCWTITNKWLQDAGLYGPVTNDEAVRPQTPTPAPTTTFPDRASPYLIPQPQSAHVSPYISPAQSPYVSPHHSPVMRPITPTDSDQSLPRTASHTSLNMSLEEVKAPQRQVRPSSTYNPNITFDAILGPTDQKKGKKSKK